MKEITVKQYLLKKFPPSGYMDCPIPKSYWEIMQQYAEFYLNSQKTMTPETIKQIDAINQDSNEKLKEILAISEREWKEKCEKLNKAFEELLICKYPGTSYEDIKQMWRDKVR